MNRREVGNGWTSPSIILTILSFIMAAAGSYMALQRSDAAVMLELDRRVTRIETSIIEGRARRDDQIRSLDTRLSNIEQRDHR